MNLFPQIKKLGLNILDLVFPIECIICSKDGSYLCMACYKKLPKLEKQKCIICTKPSPFGKTHPECVSRNTIDGMIYALSYKDERSKLLIAKFKYKLITDLAKPMSLLIIETIQNQGLTDYFHEFVLVPVPLHHRRRNWRGFNQAEILATELSNRLSLTKDTTMITRNKYTKPQTKLSADERKLNIQNAFTVTSDVTNKKIILVDDVVTSGSTVNEIAKLLKQNKASEIWVMSIAHG